MIDYDNQMVDDVEVGELATEVKITTTGIDIRDGKDVSDKDVTKVAIGTGSLGSKMTYEVTGIFAGDESETTKTFTDDNKDGTITVTNEFVLGNTYTFHQLSVKSPYNTVADFAVTIDTDKKASGTEAIKVTNHMNRVAFTLTDQDGNALEGGKFSLYDENGEAVDGYTDMVSKKDTLLGNSKVEIAGIEPGIYTLKETDAPVGTKDGKDFYYALDDSGITFELKADNTVSIMSVNDDATVLKGYGSANNTTVVGATLGTKGSLIKSEEAVITYVNIPTVILFETNVRYNEDCSDSSSDLTAFVTGLTYGVYEEKACVTQVATGTSDENGVIVVEGLQGNQTYYVKMIETAATNVVVDDTVFAAEVTVSSGFTGLKYANGSYVGNGGLTLEVNRQDIVLSKKDKEDTSKALADSTYAIYRKSSVGVSETTNYSGNAPLTTNYKDEEWSLVTTSVTNESGQIVFKGVDVGIEYLIQEVSEPSGYQVSKDPVLVRFVKQTDGSFKLTAVDDGSGTASIAEDGTVTWYEPRLKVEVRLVDEDGNLLSGGNLDMVASDSSTLRSWTTSSENELFSGVLTGGSSYTIVQTTAPDGYDTAENVTFTAEAKALSATENYVQVVTVVNKKSAAQTTTEDTTAQSDDSSDDSKDKTDDSEDSSTVEIISSEEKSPKTGEWSIWDKIFK